MSGEFPKALNTKLTSISRWLEVIEREVQFQSAAAVETYYAIAQPDDVAAIAVTPEKRILLVRQYRPAIQRFSLELPAGTVEENETPADGQRALGGNRLPDKIDRRDWPGSTHGQKLRFAF